MILNEDQTYFYCIWCPFDFTHKDYNKGLFHGNHVKNIKKHLKRHYNIIFEKALSKNQAKVNHQLQQLYHQAKAINQTDKLDAKILYI